MTSRAALLSIALATGVSASAHASDSHAHEAEATPAETTSAATPALPVEVDDGSVKPYKLVRTLNALQDQTGVGNKSAHSAQRSLLQRIGEEMATVQNEAWASPRNGRALVSFVLSGGEPGLLKRLLEQKVEIGGVDIKVAAAAAAFAERRADEARALLSDVKPREIEPSLAAHVALVQGIVFAQREPEKAIEAFELARLFAPGSLVEQGALRRQAMVESKLGRWDRAEKLAAQYLRRFGQAVYAPTFYRELVEQLALEPDNRDEDQFARLKRLFNLLGEKERRQTYLLLAERAILLGKVKMARFASARASELYDAGSRERARLDVYGAAANVASDQTPEGLAVLQSVDRRRLGTRDTLLADAAIEVGEDVRREPHGIFDAPGILEMGQDATLAEAAGSPADTSEHTASPVVDLARKSIDKVDELLKATKQ